MSFSAAFTSVESSRVSVDWIETPRMSVAATASVRVAAEL
jgi:hypothetical protein